MIAFANRISSAPWEKDEEARKKYTAAAGKVEPGRRYNLGEAVAKVKEIAFAKFDETVELTVWLGVDPRKADQLVRGTLVLPHGLGKSKKVLVIAQGENQRGGGSRRRFCGRRRHGQQDQGGLAGF